MSNVTDQELLDMANHSQSLVDKAESHVRGLKQENLELKKIIATCYGMIRMLDENFDYGCDRDHEIYCLVGFLRTFLSEAIETELE